MSKPRIPDALSPQLATLVKAPPAGPGWLFEIKFDGYRLLARVDGGDIRLLTRNGHDWTAKLRPLQAELLALGLPTGWYDGEIVRLDDKGVPSFSLLQRAFDNRHTGHIILFLFDAPFCHGRDIRMKALEYRRDVLANAIGTGSDVIRLSSALAGPPRDLLASACKLGLEGLIGKRCASGYSPGRSDAWVKLKCSQRQEFVIGGYTLPEGLRAGFGSLLLGYYDDDGELRYAGSVGTGFDERQVSTVAHALESLESSTPTFRADRIAKKNIRWVRPKLVAEVAFAEWTPGGRIRHATFRGLRNDKVVRSIRRETAV